MNYIIYKTKVLLLPDLVIEGSGHFLLKIPWIKITTKEQSDDETGGCNKFQVILKNNILRGFA